MDKNKLTVDDVMKIVHIADDLLDGMTAEQSLKLFKTERRYYEEVLRLYNEN